MKLSVDCNKDIFKWLIVDYNKDIFEQVVKN